MQATKQLHSHIQPEARRPNSNGIGIPTTLFDKSTSTSDMIHPLQSSFTHNFVDIEDDSGRRANDSVSVGVL